MLQENIFKKYNKFNIMKVFDYIKPLLIMIKYSDNNINIDIIRIISSYVIDDIKDKINKNFLDKRISSFLSNHNNECDLYCNINNMVPTFCIHSKLFPYSNNIDREKLKEYILKKYNNLYFSHYCCSIDIGMNFNLYHEPEFNMISYG